MNLYALVKNGCHWICKIYVSTDAFECFGTIGKRRKENIMEDYVTRTWISPMLWKKYGASLSMIMQLNIYYECFRDKLNLNVNIAFQNYVNEQKYIFLSYKNKPWRRRDKEIQIRSSKLKKTRKKETQREKYSQKRYETLWHKWIQYAHLIISCFPEFIKKIVLRVTHFLPYCWRFHCVPY